MTYKIFHGPDVVHFIEGDSTAVSGQPNQEEFVDETEAVSRVLELDEDYFPKWYREGDYLKGDRVLFLGSIYRALQDNDAKSFGLSDPGLEPAAGTPTPMNRPSRWKEVYAPDSKALGKEPVTAFADVVHFIEGDSVDEQSRRRAHNADGTFKANDPNTSENEAWE